MGRIRQIKPEFWTSLAIGQLTRDARLLFIGLWNYADDDGRAVAEPRLIKGDVFPLDDDLDHDAVTDLLDELESQGRIVRYRACGKPLLQVVNWPEHQYVQRKRRSSLPGPEQADPPEPEPSVKPHGAVPEGSVLGLGVKGSRGQGVEGSRGQGIRGSSSGSPTQLEAPADSEPDDDDLDAALRTEAAITVLVDQAEQQHRHDGIRIGHRTRWRRSVHDDMRTRHGVELLTIARAAPHLEPRQLVSALQHPSYRPSPPPEPDVEPEPPVDLDAARAGLRSVRESNGV